MTSFYWICFEVASNILRALALGIGLDEDHLLKLHSGHYNQLRLLHYPPIQDRFVGDERLTRARYSIPYFVTTDPDLVIECLPSCIDEEHAAKYEPITQRDYSNMRARMQY